MLSKRFLASAILAMGAAVFGLGRNEAKLADVASGKATEARLSWWGFDKDDATAIFNEAMASKATTIIVDKMESPWLLTPVFAKSNLTLVFEEGAEFMAKKDCFKAPKDAMLTLKDVENVKIIGQGQKGGILRMRRADYDDKKQYRHAEWRHTLNLLSARNVTVTNMSMVESGGDGIYIGVSDTMPRTFCKDIVIKDCVCDRNYRQGISVIACTNLLIENTFLTNTCGTAPQAGIDFEPNGPDEPLVNCVMKNCVTEGNAGAGYDFYLPKMDTRRSGKASFRFEGCISRNEKRCPFIFTTSDSKNRGRKWEGSVVVSRCTFQNAPEHGMFFNIDAANTVNIEVKNTSIVNSGTEVASQSPFCVSYGRGNPGTFGKTKIRLSNLVIDDKRDVPWLAIGDSAFCGIDHYDIAGSVAIVKNRNVNRFNVTKATIAKLYPDAKYDKVNIYDMTGKTYAPAAFHGTTMPKIKARDNGYFWFYANAGQDISFTLHNARLTRLQGITATATVVYPSGKSQVLGKVPFTEKKTFTFKAAEGGICHVDFPVGNVWATMLDCNVPCGLRQKDGRGIAVIYTTGHYFFHVPEDAKFSSIRFLGQNSGEGCNVKLIDPSGKTVWQKEDVGLGTAFSFGEKPIAGIWEVVLDKPTHISHEDFILILCGLPPYIAPERDLALRP